MRNCRNIFVGILLACSGAVDASEFTQQTARSFGYVIGDVIEQRILLESNGQSLELTELPPEQRVGRWLERLSATLITSGSEQVSLLLHYQIINAPSELITISIPALSLVLVDGKPLIVDAWPISISPLIPPMAADAEAIQLLQPDRQPARPEIRVVAQRLKFTSLAFVITVLSWLAWWFWRQNADAIRLPFARALHDIRKLDAEQLDENPHAWMALHHAFNGTAGRTINSGAITELIRQKPWMKSMQTRIEAFYTASASRFFEQAPKPQGFALFEFGKALYLAEKRHAGGHQPQARA